MKPSRQVSVWHVSSNNILKMRCPFEIVFNFVFEYATRNGLKLIGSDQFLTYRDDINILGWGIIIVKINGEYPLRAFMEIGLQINADKNKYNVMSRYQNAGRINRLGNENISLEILL